MRAVMRKPVWHFPKTINEALVYLQQEKAHIHAGGTGIKPEMLRKWQTVIDISQLSLNQITESDDEITLGANLTFKTVVDYFKDKHPGHILYQALVRSSSASLRNRITLGGSIASFHTWSDLPGPLLALDAELTLEGKARQQIKLSEYFGDSDLHRNSLITSIHFPKREWIGYFHRQVRVQFDYPVFSLAITADIVDSVYKDCRIFVVGTYGKFTRMTKLENYLKQKNVAETKRDEMIRLMDFEFRDKPFCSGDYLKKLASEQLINGINNINGNNV